MAKRDYQGLLFIGDPHLASRVPGLRKDEYPRVTLAKLSWCLDYARRNDLLPAILGDLFHQPRDNANWLLGELVELLGSQEVIGVQGNHDVRENQLGDDDSLSIIIKAQRLHLVDRDGPWHGLMSHRPVVVGGTAWGQWLPETFDPATVCPALDGRPLVFWLAHHDVIVPGYEEHGRFQPRPIPGVDVVVNGHIHRRLEDVRTDNTLWITPGNIARVARSDITRQHVPGVLRVDITAEAPGWQRQMVEVPHQPFDQVFHEAMVTESLQGAQSAFVQGLAELQAHRTETGAGLMEFLQSNISQFEQAVADEVLTLAREVTSNGDQTIQS